VQETERYRSRGSCSDKKKKSARGDLRCQVGEKLCNRSVRKVGARSAKSRSEGDSYVTNEKSRWKGFGTRGEYRDMAEEIFLSLLGRERGTGGSSVRCWAEGEEWNEEGRE